MADDYSYLSSLSAHPNRAGDTSNFNPAFATPLANAIRQARAAGLNVGLESGFREPGQTGSAYDAGGNSSHTYGLASDISGLDGPNGKITNQWAQIAQANGLHNPYGVGNKAEFNHWQLPEQPLEKNPQLLASLQQAKATGNINNVWSTYNGAASSASAAPAAKPSYTFALPANAPMGMGNNNPLNIKYYKGAEKDYSGLIGPSTNTDQGDPQMKFGSPEAGWAAAYTLLNKKYGSGMTTPNQIIAGKGGWTPGNTQAAANVAKTAGIGPDDDIGFSDPAKAQRFMRALVTQEQGGAGSAYPDAMISAAITGKPTVHGTTLNSSPVAAGGPAAAPATGQPAPAPGGLPGFQAGSAGEKMTQAGLKTLGLDGGKGAGGDSGGDQQPDFRLNPIAPAMPVGGAMMMGAGGQNVPGRSAAGAQNELAQLAAYGRGVQPQSQAAAPGMAQGIPSMPGTTLNSPSAVQMALMTGSINPYDMYARTGMMGGAGGFGST